MGDLAGLELAAIGYVFGKLLRARKGYHFRLATLPRIWRLAHAAMY
jgi:hypothetical protein